MDADKLTAADALEYLREKIASGDMPEDEPVFVLRARDDAAAETVYFWIGFGRQSETKKYVARKIAKAMSDWPVKRVEET